jgi:phospholipid/cholesterol/gamma-HCH transport system permease protein
MPPPTDLQTRDRDGARVLTLRGTLDFTATGQLWTPVLRAARDARGRLMVLDLADVSACDSAGATLLLEAERVHRGDTTTEAAQPPVAAILARIRDVATPPPPPGPPPPPATWRETILAGLRLGSDGVVFLGEVSVAALHLPGRARMFRLADLLRYADQSGVQAIPLVLLLGVLIGLILAFQSLIPMRQFGADIYVASLVSISLIRELGPLLAAVILSGRSGSAFAAEIGTMKLNQELDALSVMGIDPVTMLVLPRLAAAIVVMPVMTILLDLAGLLGMSLVLVGAGLPLTAIAHQVEAWVDPGSLYGGLFKAAMFGAAIALIGCRAGLSTGVGPRAVGQSATRGVVGGIVISIVLDGVFALMFYKLGI